MNINGRSFKAAIFDLDGTLIESNSVWEKLDKIILQRRGLSMSNEFVESLTAMSYDEAAAEFRKIGLNISTEDFIAEINELAEYEYAHNIFFKEGAREYLDKLKGNGIKLGIATASPESLYVPVLKNNDVYDYFDVFVTTEEAGRGKEYPDVYVLTASKLSVKNEECVVFEDILKGILSASSVGMMTVGVYDFYSKADKYKIIDASNKYIQNFNELL